MLGIGFWLFEGYQAGWQKGADSRQKCQKHDQIFDSQKQLKHSDTYCKVFGAVSKLSIEEAEEKEQANHPRFFDEAKSCWFYVHKKREEGSYIARNSSQSNEISKKKQGVVWITPQKAGISTHPIDIQQ